MPPLRGSGVFGQFFCYKYFTPNGALDLSTNFNYFFIFNFIVLQYLQIEAFLTARSTYTFHQKKYLLSPFSFFYHFATSQLNNSTRSVEQQSSRVEKLSRSKIKAEAEYKIKNSRNSRNSRTDLFPFFPKGLFFRPFQNLQFPISIVILLVSGF